MNFSNIPEITARIGITEKTYWSVIYFRNRKFSFQYRGYASLLENKWDLTSTDTFP